MCLAIPSRIVEIDREMAIIDVEGVRRQASLLLVEDARVGDYVIVHAGFALRKLDPEAAQESIRLLREAAGAFPDRSPGNPSGSDPGAL
jgi:hydrogenase expression/formation protein HypC